MRLVLAGNRGLTYVERALAAVNRYLRDGYLDAADMILIQNYKANKRNYDFARRWGEKSGIFYRLTRRSV